MAWSGAQTQQCRAFFGGGRAQHCFPRRVAFFNTHRWWSVDISLYTWFVHFFDTLFSTKREPGFWSISTRQDLMMFQYIQHIPAKPQKQLVHFIGRAFDSSLPCPPLCSSEQSWCI